MEYTIWRQAIFGQPSGTDGTMDECQEETYQLSPDENLEHVNRMLDDPEIHQLYSRDEIGAGLELIYEPCLSETNRCYTRTTNDRKRLEGIRRIRNLYLNFFGRYCPNTIGKVGSIAGDKMGFLCYMLWDIFPLYHGELVPGEAAAILHVLKEAINMHNESCIASAIHGLGHHAEFRVMPTRHRVRADCRSFAL